jgi:hypothetical protein
LEEWSSDVEGDDDADDDDDDGDEEDDDDDEDDGDDGVDAVGVKGGVGGGDGREEEWELIPPSAKVPRLAPPYLLTRLPNRFASFLPLPPPLSLLLSMFPSLPLSCFLAKDTRRAPFPNPPSELAPSPDSSSSLP